MPLTLSLSSAELVRGVSPSASPLSCVLVCSAQMIRSEEAAMRLVQREARINLEVERSCKALAAERDERVGGVAAVKVHIFFFSLC